MKPFNIFFIVVFIFSALLQYNDPDPYIWVPIYLFGAWICYEAIKGIFRPFLYIAGFVIYGLYAIYLFFDKTGVLNWVGEHDAENLVQSMKATRPWIEETREFGGLLILLFALCVNWFWWRKKILV